MTAKHLPIALLCSVLLLSAPSCQHQPIPTLEQVNEHYCLLANIYHEARGEGVEGMQAVALVTLNRARQQARSVCAVVYQHKQFSWANTSNGRNKPLDDVDAAISVVAQVLSGKVDDITHGATHYHAQSVKPKWARKTKPVATINKHLFYKL